MQLLGCAVRYGADPQRSPAERVAHRRVCISVLGTFCTYAYSSRGCLDSIRGSLPSCLSALLRMDTLQCFSRLLACELEEAREKVGGGGDRRGSKRGKLGEGGVYLGGWAGVHVGTKQSMGRRTCGVAIASLPLLGDGCLVSTWRAPALRGNARPSLGAQACNKLIIHSWWPALYVRRDP